MNYIVAVSGGVDSVVLLDMLVRGKIDTHGESGASNIIVAHFDHGIREDSAADGRFVAALAEQYGVAFEMTREILGPQASEALARERRYAFLRTLAKTYAAKIITAHHADDTVATIAINIKRGTGWRGLAVFGAEDIERPFLNRTKKELYTYALQHRLEWVEDSTNVSDIYLRNRLRTHLARLPRADQERLRALHRAQQELKQRIEQELNDVSDKNRIDRYFLTQCPDVIACELLRWLIARQSGKQLTWPTIARALLAVKTAAPQTSHQLGEGVALRLGVRDIVVEPLKKMI